MSSDANNAHVSIKEGHIISSEVMYNFLSSHLSQLYHYTTGISTQLPTSIFNNTSKFLTDIASISNDFFQLQSTLSTTVRALQENDFKTGNVVSLKDLVNATLSAITYASNIRFCECITHTEDAKGKQEFNIKNRGLLFLKPPPTMKALLKDKGTDGVELPYAEAVADPLSHDYRYNFAYPAIALDKNEYNPNQFINGQIYLSSVDKWNNTLSSKTTYDNNGTLWGPLTSLVNTRDYSDSLTSNGLRPIGADIKTGQVIKADDFIKIAHTIYHITNRFRWDLSCRFGFETYTLVYVYDPNCFTTNTKLSVDPDTGLSCYCSHTFDPTAETEITIINPLSIGFKLREDQVRGNYYLSAEFRGWSINSNAKLRGAYLKADINYSSGVKIKFNDIEGKFNTKKKLYIYPVFNGHFYNKTDKSEEVSTDYIALYSGSNNYTLGQIDTWSWHTTKRIYELQVLPNSLGSVYDTFTPNSLSVYDGRANQGNPAQTNYGHQLVKIKSYFNSRFELSVREDIAKAQNRADGGGLTFNVSSENNTTVDARWGCQFNTKSTWRRFPTVSNLRTSLLNYKDSLNDINSNLYNNVSSDNIASTLSNLFRSKTSYSPNPTYRFMCQNHGSHVGDTFIVWTRGTWYRKVSSYNKRSGFNISDKNEYIAIYPSDLSDKAEKDKGYQIRVCVYPTNLVAYSSRFKEWNEDWSCMPYTFTRVFLPIASLSTYIDTELIQSSGRAAYGPDRWKDRYLGAAWCKLTTNGKLFKLK